ncbi:MAG: transglutaminase domain-containing protein [Chloroflexota bacterium]
MKKLVSILHIAFVAALAIFAGTVLYALPAMLTLPRGVRPGLRKLTLQQAAQQLRATGKYGWDLVEAARALVAGRMQYCRRNSFDVAGKAFERGYGYCQQQAFALAGLLASLGFEVQVVQAVRNSFPDGRVGGHAWVRVTIDGESREVDSILYDAQARAVTFVPLTKVTGYTPLFRIFAGWGSAAVNAHRYYITGKDL